MNEASGFETLNRLPCWQRSKCSSPGTIVPVCPEALATSSQLALRSLVVVTSVRPNNLSLFFYSPNMSLIWSRFRIIACVRVWINLNFRQTNTNHKDQQGPGAVCSSVSAGCLLHSTNGTIYSKVASQQETSSTTLTLNVWQNTTKLLYPPLRTFRNSSSRGRASRPPDVGAVLAHQFWCGCEARIIDK